MTEDFVIRPKKFRNKKTGEIKTQISIFELDDYEEINEKPRNKKKMKDVC